MRPLLSPGVESAGSCCGPGAPPERGGKPSACESSPACLSACLNHADMRHVGTLPQFATCYIHCCPFSASLETQFMSSFVCIAAHLAATGGIQLTMNPKLRSHSRESVYKGPDYSRCRGSSRFQGSVTRAWAKVTPQLF